MKSFIDASSADTGSGAASWMVAKLSGIVNTYVGAFLPENFNAAPSIDTLQAEECFKEMGNVLDDLRAASSTAEIKQKASAAPDSTGGTTSWWYCAYSKSLIQVDPAVVALHPNLLELSPLYNDWDIDKFLDDTSHSLAPAVDTYLFPLEEARHAPAPAMDPSLLGFDSKSPPFSSDMETALFTDLDDESHSLEPAVDTYLFPLEEARHAPAPAMDPSLLEFDTKSPPFPSAMETALFTDLDDEGYPLAPGVDTPLFPLEEARHAPAPAMDPSLLEFDNKSPPFPSAMETSLFTDLDDESHPLAPGVDPFLSAFGEAHHFLSPAVDPALFFLDEPRHAPAPEIDPSLLTDLDNESHPLAPPMDPSLFSLSEAHDASAPATSPPLFIFEEAHHAPVPALDPSPFGYDEESCVNTIPQRKLRGAAMNDFTDDTILAQAQGEVAADEPFELEAFIVASRRKFGETKVRREEQGYEGSYIARSVLEVFEDVAVYVDDLLAEILPGWLNPTSGLVERAEECFHDTDVLPVRPDWDPRNSHSEGLYELDDVDDGRFEGAGWLFCVPKNRFVQQDPTLLCPDNAVIGRRAATSSPSSKTEHIHDAREDIYDDHSPVDAIVAADYALYVAEHMQLALYVPLESYLPAATAARLARHIAELADEHAAFETVLERFFARDKQEEERVAIETRAIEARTIETQIMTQMQNLLSGGGEKQLEEEEEALSPVCHATECYAFVPIDVATTQCDAVVDVLWEPLIDECTPLETLQGNDQHASSRSDCHLYLPPVSFCYTPVSIENSASFYDAWTSLYDTPGSHCNIPKLDRQPTAEERLFAFLGGVWAAADREDELRMTAGELQQVIAAAVAEGVKDREETLREQFRLELDLFRDRDASSVQQQRELAGKQEADDDVEKKEEDRPVESKQKEESTPPHGRRKKTHRADVEKKEEDRPVESKQKEESTPPHGRRKKTHRAGRKHRKGPRIEDGLGGGGGGGGGGGAAGGGEGGGGGEVGKV